MSNIDNTTDLPPEIIGEIVSYTYHALPAHALQRCALVSRAWYLQARPYVFADLVILLEAPSKQDREKKERSRRRLASLLDTMDETPDIAQLVRSLKIVLQPGVSSITFRELSETLVQLVTQLNSLHTFVFQNKGVKSRWHDDGWWTNEIDGVARAVVEYVCALPSLRHLRMNDAGIPCQVYFHHPGLKSLSIRGYMYIPLHAEDRKLCEDAMDTGPPLTMLRMGTGLATAFHENEWFNGIDYVLRHRPGVFDNLTQLHLVAERDDLDMVERALLQVKDKLQELSLVYISSFDRPQFKSTDFAPLKFLRSLTLQYTTNSYIHGESVEPIIASIATLEHIPHLQRVRIQVSAEWVGEIGVEAAKVDFLGLWNQIDALLSKKLPTLRQIRLHVEKGCEEHLLDTCSCAVPTHFTPALLAYAASHPEVELHTSFAPVDGPGSKDPWGLENEF